MPQVLLHLATGDVTALIGIPALIAVALAGLVILAVLEWGWRIGLWAAALGLVLLVAGVSGDLVVHASSHDHELPMMLMMHPGTSRLVSDQELALERQNRWHLLAAAGEGMLLAGMDGACFALWRRVQRLTRTEAPAVTPAAGRTLDVQLPRPLGRRRSANTRTASSAGPALRAGCRW
jgi:hypothetical protein